MATTIGEVNINLRLSMAQFKQDVDSGTGAAKKSMNDLKDSVSHSSKEATGSLALIGEMIGVTIPRHIRGFITDIPGVGTALNAAFSGVAALALIEVIVKIVEKIQEYKKHLEEAAKAWEETGEKGEQALRSLDEQLTSLQLKLDELNHDHIAAMQDELKLVNAQKLDQIIGEFTKLQTAADGAFKKSKVGWLSSMLGLGSDSGVENVQKELDEITSKVKALAEQGKSNEIPDVINKQIDGIITNMAQAASNGWLDTAGGRAIQDALQHELDQLNLMYSAYMKIDGIAINKTAVQTKEDLEKATEEAKKLNAELDQVIEYLSKAGSSSRTISKGGTNPYLLGAPSGGDFIPGFTSMQTGASAGQAPLYSGTKEAKDQLDLLTNQNAQIERSQDLYTSTRNAEERYANEMKELNTLLASGALDQDTYNRAVSAAKLKYDDLTRGLQEIGSSLGQSISQAALYGGSWTKAFQDVAAEIVKVVLQMTILKRLQQSAAASGGGGFTGFLSSIFSGLTARASGGPVRQGEGYLVGENGPEFFSPSTSGTIIPNGGMSGGGAAPIVNNVQIDVHGVQDVDSFRRSEGQVAASMAAALERHQRRNG